MMRATAATVTGLALTMTASTASASGALELIPDWGLFGLFGSPAGFGELWIMVILFVLLILPLNALIFQPLFAALDARAERIAGARSRSLQLQQDADEVLDRYERAIREARAESEAARKAKLETARTEQATLTTAARSEAESEIERARQELSDSVASARNTLRTSADALAQAAAERVLGRAL